MKLKKLVALLLVSVLMVSLTGCVGNLYEYAGTVGGEDISSGLYLMLQMSALTEARNLVEDSEKDVRKQKIEGESANTWLRNRTEKNALTFVAVQQLTTEKKIYVSEENRAGIDESMGYWEMASEYYERNGISKQTLERYMVNQALADELFMSVFGEGGERASTDKELMKEYAEQNAHVRFISIPKNSIDETKEVDTDKLNSHVEKMLKSLKDGKTMNEVAEKQLAGAYEIIGREFDQATASTNVTTTFISYEPEDFKTYSEEFLKTLREQKVGEFGMYEMDSTIMLYEKIEAFEKEEDFAAMRNDVLRSLRKDAFDEYLKETYSKFDVSWRFGARWFLRPSKIEV